MTGARPAVFISYSHKDEHWKNRLVAHLRVLEREGALDLWDDRRLAAGDEWRPDIEQAIAHATVAILIVSKDFLTSQFIREEELTQILARRSQRQLRVIPLIAEPCAWQAVEALQGIQARPIDGRALSGGTEHEIDQALSALALEIRALAANGTDAVPERAPVPKPWHALSAMMWLSLPTIILVLLVVVASYWHVATRVSLELVTRRMSFVSRGEQPRSLVNSTGQFSALSIERCAGATLTAASFVRIRALNGTADGDQPHAGPVRLRCDDPDAKITLVPAGEVEALGSLDRLSTGPGARTVIAVRGATPPVVTMTVSTRQELSFPIFSDLRIIADLVAVEPALGSSDSPAFYEARLDQADRMVRVETGERGAVLVITPAPASTTDFFDTDRPLAIESLQFVDEALGGQTVTPFLADGILSYPDYPGAPALTIAGDDFLVLDQTRALELRRLALDSTRAGLLVTVAGLLSDGAIGSARVAPTAEPDRDRWFDPRLTVFQTIRYGSPWTIIALGLVWATSTIWSAYGRWPFAGRLPIHKRGDR
ncbi:MAG TPA: toll/interleukin-1 receptor domain-containing protein [Vicinamibacterales bacterium]|nr:toll/interleukin-1 receptor domain-containing protein [Vicinamibacterales bacterium]